MAISLAAERGGAPGPRMLICGTAGIGRTSFGRAPPTSVFLQPEDTPALVDAGDGAVHEKRQENR